MDALGAGSVVDQPDSSGASVCGRSAGGALRAALSTSEVGNCRGAVCRTRFDLPHPCCTEETSPGGLASSGLAHPQPPAPVARAHLSCGFVWLSPEKVLVG